MPGVKESAEMDSQKKFDGGKMGDAWVQSVTNLWACMLEQALSGAGSTASQDDGETLRLFLRLNEMGLEGFSLFSREISRCFQQAGPPSEGGAPQEMGEKLCQIWNEMYEKKFSRIFQLPKLGLLSIHQEKTARMLDKYNRLQASLAELSRLFYQPFSHCQKKMTVKLAALVKNGDAPRNTRDCYKEWVNELETRFMSLLQTPRYISALSITLSALSDFMAVRDEAIEDMLAMFPVAKKTDVDDMARELHELKRRLGKLEKKVRPEVVYTAV